MDAGGERRGARRNPNLPLAVERASAPGRCSGGCTSASPSRCWMMRPRRETQRQAPGQLQDKPLAKIGRLRPLRDCGA